MNTSHLRRGTLVSVLAALLLGLFAPMAANAASTAQFTVTPSSGRPGDPVRVAAVDSCPPIPDTGDMPYQDVLLSFIDSAGVSSGEQVVTGTGTDGSWDSGAFFPYPHFPPPTFDPTKLTHEPAVGTGSLHVRCVLWDGTVTQEYAPQSFNVTGAAYRMAGPPTTVPPGDVVKITSVDPCPGDRVNVSLMTPQNMVNATATPDASGAWTIGIPAAVEEMDGSLTPFEPGVYGMRAYCMTDGTAEIHFAYADGTFTVGNSTPTPVCNDVLFVAVAGSGQHYDGDTNLTITPELKKVYDGLREVIPTNKTVGVQVLDYPALSVDVLFNVPQGTNPKDVPGVLSHNIGAYMGGKDAGVTALYEAVGHAHFTCPNQAIVLAGYSQGGMVVHEFLSEYAQTDGPNKNAIKAVVLVADAMRTANSGAFNFGSAPSDSSGLCQYLVASVPQQSCNNPPVPVLDIPAMYRPLTTVMCNRFDVVCDTSTLATNLWSHGYRLGKVGLRVHTSYASDPLTKTSGKRAGRQVNKGL